MRKFLVKIGRILQKLSRLCFHAARDVCWVCGKDCGFRSEVDRWGLWCTECASTWRDYKNQKGLIFDWKGLGRLKKAAGPDK